jgi:hypothetical protein
VSIRSFLRDAEKQQVKVNRGSLGGPVSKPRLKLIFPRDGFSCIRIIMVKQTKTVHKKSRGRPAGVKFSGTIPARFEPATVAALDAWADAHDVSRSEAIRQLVEIGLKAKK